METAEEVYSNEQVEILEKFNRVSVILQLLQDSLDSPYSEGWNGIMQRHKKLWDAWKDITGQDVTNGAIDKIEATMEEIKPKMEVKYE